MKRARPDDYDITEPDDPVEAHAARLADEMRPYRLLGAAVIRQAWDDGHRPWFGGRRYIAGVPQVVIFEEVLNAIRWLQSPEDAQLQWWCGLAGLEVGYVVARARREFRTTLSAIRAAEATTGTRRGYLPSSVS